MNYLLLFIPLLTAATGWIIIKMATWLLFHPVQPTKIFGIIIQGIYPAQRFKLATRIGEAIRKSDALDSIGQKISDPANVEKITPLIEEHIDDFLRNRLKSEMPMIAMFIGDKTIATLKQAFLKEIQTLFPQVMSAYASNFKKDLDITGLISHYAERFTPQETEKKLRQAISAELRTATITATIIGLIIGIIQLGIVLLILNKP